MYCVVHLEDSPDSIDYDIPTGSTVGSILVNKIVGAVTFNVYRSECLHVWFNTIKGK